MPRRWGIALLVSAFCGCASTYTATLKPKAASTLHCDQSQVTISSTSTLCQVATGCGRTDVLVYEDTWTSFRERLTFELSCADADIDIKILSPSVYGVTGCGKRLVYRYISTPGTIGIFADTAQKSVPSTDDTATK
jgi:hypothetical protein